MRQIIILAGGGARRGWTWERHKVMAEVEGKPVVLRIVEQVQHNCVVLTENVNVIQVIEDVVPCYVPPPHPLEMDWHYKRPIGALVNSIPLWSEDERTILLCGDVVFPIGIVEAILEDTDPISVWGTCAEIVGITFAPEEYHRMAQAVWDALHSDTRHGHLWVLYRVLCGFSNVHHHRLENTIFKKIDDDAGIIDFDSVEKYEKWMRKNPWAQKEE